MILNIKRVAVTLIVISVLIAGIAVMWTDNRSEDSRTTEKENTQNNIVNIPADNQKRASMASTISYFAEYRMQRERTRGKQIELLREIINNQDSEAKAREAASLRLIQISQDMENEMKSENLVKSRGYKECVVIIQPKKTMVIVQSKKLNPEQENELVRLVSNATGGNKDEIEIILKKS